MTQRSSECYFLQVSQPVYAELASPAQNYTVLVLARRKVQDMMLLLRRGFLSSEKIAPSLLLHVLPGRYEVEELNRLAEHNGCGECDC